MLIACYDFQVIITEEIHSVMKIDNVFLLQPARYAVKASAKDPHLLWYSHAAVQHGHWSSKPTADFYHISNGGERVDSDGWLFTLGTQSHCSTEVTEDVVN